MWCIWSIIWFLFSELNRTFLLQPSVWPLFVVSHERKKLMGWIKTQPQHIMPVPAPLFFHCLVYFLRYILRYMGEFLRPTSLLYLGSWIFVVQACDMFIFFIFLSPTPFSAVYVSWWESGGLPCPPPQHRVCIARPGESFCLCRPLLLHAASTSSVPIANIIFLLNTQS